MADARELILSPGYWQEQLTYFQQLLEERRATLIEREAELAERLAAINAFEFKLRAHVGHLANRLDALDQEIKQFRRRIRGIAEDWGDFEPDAAAGATADARDVFHDDGPAQEGAYRYLGEAPTGAPTALDAAATAEIKQLYRQLARRFHPDMGRDETDRDHRTQMMMAINAAYAAHDLDKLRELALEPDSNGRYDFIASDEQRVEFLRQELQRLERRLAEARRELTRLEHHKSARLLRRAQEAAAAGRDFLAELAAQMKGQISRKMVERDVLKTEIEALLADAGDLHGDEIADSVWLWSLDSAYEEDPLSEMESWLEKRRASFDWDEDILDDSE